MNKSGIKDATLRNGLMAIAQHEGGFGEMKPEMGYSRTGNARIRQVFGSRMHGLSDREIDQLKASDKAFFNFVYNGSNIVGRQLGNRPNTDDGYNFRGRGPIQLTGRFNYERYTRMAGCPEVMDNLDLVNDPNIGAVLSVLYVIDHYKGGGFEALLKAVGNNTADIAARKRATYKTFSQAKRYDYVDTTA